MTYRGILPKPVCAVFDMQVCDRNMFLHYCMWERKVLDGIGRLIVATGLMKVAGYGVYEKQCSLG